MLAIAAPLALLSSCRFPAVSLPAMETPGRGDRVLLLIPHPDDETLATGGLIQQLVKRGAKTRVVIWTSGEAFSIVAHRLYPADPFTPALFIKLGRRRMGESKIALKRFGLPPDAVRFMGYPDGGLERLWTDRWPRSRPLVARRTEATRSPFGPGIGNQASNYSGESLLGDLESEIRDFRPTLVVYPHPGDFNRDHRTLGAFTQMALCRLARDRSLSLPREVTYLVHWGEGWPWPFAARPEAPLDPPTPLLDIENGWRRMEMTKDEAQVKQAALGIYRTQLASPREAGFMSAFMRRTESFRVLKPSNAAPNGRAIPKTISTAPNGAAIPASTASAPNGASIREQSTPAPNGAIIREPTDSVHPAPGFSPAVDLVSVQATADAEALRIRIRFREPIRPDAVCRIDLRTIGPGSASTYVASVHPPGRRSESVGMWSGSGPDLEWRLPRAALGQATEILLSVATLHEGREWDRSAWTVWSLDRSPVPE